MLKDYILDLELKLKRRDVRLRALDQDQQGLIPLPQVKRLPTPPILHKSPSEVEEEEELPAPVVEVPVPRPVKPFPGNKAKSKKNNPGPTLSLEAVQAQAARLGFSLTGKMSHGALRSRGRCALGGKEESWEIESEKGGMQV